jgi:undecaprenyl-diphosphatase
MSPRALAWAAAAALLASFLALAGLFWAQTNVDRDSTPSGWSELVGGIGGVGVLPFAVLLGAALLARSGRVPAARFLLASVVGAGLLMYVARAVLQAVGADDDGGRLSDYPSGHLTAVSAAAVAAAAIVWSETERRLARWVAVAVAVCAILGMSLARLDTGAHGAVDVAGGIALGIGWTAVCIAVMPPSGARLPTRAAALLTLLSVGVAGFVLIAVLYGREPFTTIDSDTAARIDAELPGWAAALARPFSWLGGWIGITALTVVAVVLLARERNWLDVGFLLAAAAGSQVVVAILKERIGRARPDLGPAVPLPDSAAFPSGHATSGVAALGALTVLAAERLPSRRARVLLWSAVILVGLGVGLSRVALNVHFVTDVLAGWCLGLAWLAGCLLVRERFRASG